MNYLHKEAWREAVWSGDLDRPHPESAVESIAPGDYVGCAGMRVAHIVRQVMPEDEIAVAMCGTALWSALVPINGYDCGSWRYDVDPSLGMPAHSVSDPTAIGEAIYVSVCKSCFRRAGGRLTP